MHCNKGNRQEKQSLRGKKTSNLSNRSLWHSEKGSVDKILIEKKARRLKLISKGEVLKTYR